ncbi:MAG: HD domain-containing protein [Leptospiraceae bacterium]|nr:HD domain-containing protein [Leptospiraceae bacterium]
MEIEKSNQKNLLKNALSLIGEVGHMNELLTDHHIYRMGAYSVEIAKSLGWKPENYQLLESAALLHDTGKIFIDSSILTKPDKLTDSEWRIVQKHTIKGYKILNKINSPLFQLAAEVALNHHERWDGTGYPKKLKGEEIPISARIVSIADVFDALITKRSYRKAWDFEEAKKYIIKKSETHFDPKLVEIFISIFPEIKKIYSSFQNFNN